MNKYLSKSFFNSLSLRDEEFLIDLGIEDDILVFYLNCIKRICLNTCNNSSFTRTNLLRLCVTYKDKELFFYILSLILAGIDASITYASTED